MLPYQIFEKATKGFAVSVLVDSARAVIGRTAIQYSAAGQSRAFVHIYGAPMSVSSWTHGGGYDKNTASVTEAVERLTSVGGHDPNAALTQQALKTAFTQDANGLSDWTSLFRKAGLGVLNIT